MQFAGQRTDMDLKPIGEPHNVYIKITPDTLPDPGAVLVTGITPQKTILDGIEETKFLKIFENEIATPKTIFVGFNSLRFDDEFMRFLHYRNFRDPYEWHWADGRGRWDLLDLTRMTRALRPDGIKWPVDSEGKPTNRLELLASLNKLEHSKAHDALSDVTASIAWAKLLKTKQPKLFEHLLNLRDKKVVAELVESNQPFVYSSGKYASEFEKTTAAALVVRFGEQDSGIVFDLRHDPSELAKLSANEILERWKHRCKEWPCPHPRLPLKTIKYNRCPAVAPLGVLDESSQKRLSLELATIKKNFKLLQASKANLAKKLIEVIRELDKKQQTSLIDNEQDVDGRLYDGFFDRADKSNMQKVASATKKAIKELNPTFKSERLSQLLPLYKARNFPSQLSDDERAKWDEFCKIRLLGGGQESWAATYFNELAKQAERPGLNRQEQYLLEELQLYGQSILPIDE